MIKTLLAIAGAVHIAFWFAGMFGAIDYHVCVKAPGKCAKAPT